METIERAASRGGGAVTAAAAANNAALVGTSLGALVRHDFADGTASEAELARPGEAAVHKVKMKKSELRVQN